MKKIPWFVLLTFLLIACGPGMGGMLARWGMQVASRGRSLCP
jgi:hypothetical protein